MYEIISQVQLRKCAFLCKIGICFGGMITTFVEQYSKSLWYCSCGMISWVLTLKYVITFVVWHLHFYGVCRTIYQSKILEITKLFQWPFIFISLFRNEAINSLIFRAEWLQTILIKNHSKILRINDRCGNLHNLLKFHASVRSEIELNELIKLILVNKDFVYVVIAFLMI